jgi:hypothetical protein
MRAAMMLYGLAMVASAVTEAATWNSHAIVFRQERTHPQFASLGLSFASVDESVKMLAGDAIELLPALEDLNRAIDSALISAQGFTESFDKSDIAFINHTGCALLTNLKSKSEFFQHSSLQESIKNTKTGFDTLFCAISERLSERSISPRNGEDEGGAALVRIIEPIDVLFRTFAARYQSFMSGKKNNELQSQLVRQSASDLFAELAKANLTYIPPVTGNITIPQITQIAGIYQGMMNAASDLLGDNMYMAQPQYLNATLCQSLTSNWKTLEEFFVTMYTKWGKLKKDFDDQDWVAAKFKAKTENLATLGDSLCNIMNRTAENCHDHLSPPGADNNVWPTGPTPLPGVVMTTIVETVTEPCACPTSSDTATTKHRKTSESTTTTTTSSPTDTKPPKSVTVSVTSTTTLACICETRSRRTQPSATSITSTTTAVETPSSSATGGLSDNMAKAVGPLGLLAVLFFLFL